MAAQQSDESDKAKAAELKEEGNQFFKAGDFAKAVEVFGKAIQCDPRDHVLYSNRSGAYASMKKYDEALKDAEKCIDLKPDWPKGYSRKGLALHNLGKSEEAKKVYNAGLKVDPSNAALKDGLANINSGTPDMEDIQLQRIVRAVQSNPKTKKYADEDPAYIEKVTGIWKGLRKNPQSFATILQHPDHRLRDGLMAAMGIETKDFEDHQPPPSRPLKRQEKPKEPEKTPAQKEADEWKEKGNKLYKDREFPEALEAYDKALQICPDEITLYSNKGAVYIEMGEFDKCITQCQTALDKRYEVKASFAKVAKVYNRMAACYTRQGKLEKAIEMYEKSLLEDNDRHTRSTLKDTQRLKEKRDKEAYLNPELAEEHRVKGNEFFNAGDYPSAKREYDEALRRCTTDAKIYSNRAAALTKLGEFPSALKDCETALELDPEFVKCWIRKGNLHFSMKENHKAMSAYSQALELEPDNIGAREGRIKVMTKIQETSQSTEVDEEQYRHAMADPEIQQMLGDPQFQMILKKITENPASLADYMKDSKVAEGISKLMSAGILRTA